MPRAKTLVGLAIVALVGSVAAVPAQAREPQPDPDYTITVDPRGAGTAISDSMYGVFFEDINFAADGGLYPERVKNRSFEFPDALMAWKKSASADAQGEFAVRTDRPPSPTNPHYLRLTSKAGSYGVTNDGFRSVSVEGGKRYVVTMLARRLSRPLGAAMAIVFVLLGLLTEGLHRVLGGQHLLWLAIGVFVAAWVGQFIGHRIEGRRPSFLTDLAYLLIGPAWLAGKLMRRFGIAY